MPFPATSIVELLVFLVWNCLIQPAHKHGLFTQVLSSQEVLLDLLNATQLSFAPGFYDAIQGTRPPPLSFFLGLPSHSVKIWAVYALVLQKKNAVDLTYIGSGTEAERGVAARWGQYDKLENLPTNVQAAVDQGWAIVHKGLLLWMPLPSATNVSSFRILFVAIEAALSFLFWTLRSRSKDYGMSDCCPWDLSAFEYRGLCGHNAMLEMVSGNFDLNAEQLEHMEAQRKDNVRHYNAEYYDKYIQLPGMKEKKRQYASEYYESHAEDPEFLPKKRERGVIYQEKYSEKLSEKREDVKATEKYFCEVCNISCGKQAELKRHNESKKHLENVKNKRLGIVVTKSTRAINDAANRARHIANETHHCALCATSFIDKRAVEGHKKTRKHLAKEKAALDAVRSSP